MPNWSRTEINLAGKTEDIKHVYENIKKLGYDWGSTKMPRFLKAYSRHPEIIEDANWKTKARECRIENYYSKQGGIPYIKDSLLKKAGASSWYEWALQYWGTKWNLELQDENDLLIFDGPNGNSDIYFLSYNPWSGPKQWFLTITKEYKLSGHYLDVEPGMEHYIEIEVVDGEIVAEYDKSKVAF